MIKLFYVFFVVFLLLLCSKSERLTYKYEVYGTFKTCRVEFMDNRGKLTKQGTVRPGWEYRWKDRPTRLLAISAQNNDDTGTIILRIVRDGATMIEGRDDFLIQIKGQY